MSRRGGMRAPLIPSLSTTAGGALGIHVPATSASAGWFMDLGFVQAQCASAGDLIIYDGASSSSGTRAYQCTVPPGGALTFNPDPPLTASSGFYVVLSSGSTGARSLTVLGIPRG